MTDEQQQGNQSQRSRASLAIQTECDTAAESDFETFVRTSLKSIISGQVSLRASIELLQSQHKSLEGTVEKNAKEFGHSLDFQSNRTDVAEKNLVKLEAVNTQLKTQIKTHENELKQLKETGTNLERQSRRPNLLLCNYGPETNPENPEEIVKHVLKDKFKRDATVEVVSTQTLWC
jgi:predicted nuclease with TOPRIM domain